MSWNAHIWVCCGILMHVAHLLNIFPFSIVNIRNDVKGRRQIVRERFRHSDSIHRRRRIHSHMMSLLCFWAGEVRSCSLPYCVVDVCCWMSMLLSMSFRYCVGSPGQTWDNDWYDDYHSSSFSLLEAIQAARRHFIIVIVNSFGMGFEWKWQRSCQAQGFK